MLDVPEFRPGDTVKVHVRVVEGTRERVQVFQGAVIRRQGVGVRETFTVRKVSFGVGVERTFPVHSPDHRQARGRHHGRRPPGQALLPAGARRGRRPRSRRSGRAARVTADHPPERRTGRDPCPVRMSEEELERYEAEIELALVQEYRAVLPMFAYVVETERRFYLANEVSIVVPRRHHAGLRRGRAVRRLGVGHVPTGPLRALGAGRHLPGRERGAAPRKRALSRPARRVRDPGRRRRPRGAVIRAVSRPRRRSLRSQLSKVTVAPSHLRGEMPCVIRQGTLHVTKESPSPGWPSPRSPCSAPSGCSPASPSGRPPAPPPRRRGPRPLFRT